MLSRYASSRALPDVQQLYEPQRGRWACAPQASMLRYFLRVSSPDYGIAEVKTALAQRQSTGCYNMLLPDLKDAVAIPRVEVIAIAALDDPSPVVVRYAAEALGRYGSAAAEEPLWRRLTAFHDVWKDRGDELRSGPGMSAPHAEDSMVEFALEEALSRGQGWICGPDKLARLKTLLTSNRQPEVTARLNEWQRTPLSLFIYWPGDSGLRYSVGPYMGNSLDALVRKLRQFPRDTHFVWQITTVTQELHRADVDAVKSAAAAASLVLEIK
jgi:hypothetical protein